MYSHLNRVGNDCIVGNDNRLRVCVCQSKPYQIANQGIVSETYLRFPRGTTGEAQESNFSLGFPSTKSSFYELRTLA